MSLKISAAELKGISKRLAMSNAERVVFNFAKGEIGSSDLNLSILMKSDTLQAADVEPFGVENKMLHEVTSKLKKGDVELRVELSGIATALHLTSEKAKFLLPISKMNPIVIKPPVKKTVFPRAVLTDMLTYAAAAAESKQRFNYTGSVNIKEFGPGKPHEGQTVVVVGTDGMRLAVAEAFLPMKETFKELMLPVQAIKAIKELSGSDVEVSQTDNAIFIESTLVTIMVTKTTKTFPDYAKFLIAEPKFQAGIKAAAMREALDKVSPMLDKDAKSVRLQFNEGHLTLTTGNQLIGQATDDIAFELLLPDPLMDDPIPFDIRLNHAHVRDFFASVTGTTTLSATDKNQPVWLESDGRKLLLATLNHE